MIAKTFTAHTTYFKPQESDERRVFVVAEVTDSGADIAFTAGPRITIASAAEAAALERLAANIRRRLEELETSQLQRS